MHQFWATTHTRHHVCGLVLVIGLSAGPSLGQPLEVAAGVRSGKADNGPAVQSDDHHGNKSSRRLDAGVALLAPAYWQYRPPGGGAWLTIGGGRVRWQAGYWHLQDRTIERDSIDWGGGVVTDQLVTDFALINSLDMVVSRHFQSRGGMEPHLFVGGGYQRYKTYRCFEAVERSGGRVVWEHRPPCGVSTDGLPILVFGAGFDVSFGSRFFLRFQSRGDKGASEAHASPHFAVHQITPKTSRYTRCSSSMLPNVSINGRIRSSGQFGRW